MGEIKIPRFKLIPEPTSDDARVAMGFKWASPEIGTRHQLGGNPTFIQKECWPVCKSCGKRMTFYAQLDSIGDDISLADCGIVYVFVCFSCFETKSFIQSN